MLRKLVKTVRIEIDDTPGARSAGIDVRYFEQRTARRGRRYSSEVLLGETDRIDERLVDVADDIAALDDLLTGGRG